MNLIIRQMCAHTVRNEIILEMYEIFLRTSIRQVILLQSHLSTRNYIRNNMFLRSLLIYPVRPFRHCDHISSFLIKQSIASFVQICAATQSRYLTSAHIRNFQICVQQEIKGECQLLGWVVNAYVKM